MISPDDIPECDCGNCPLCDQQDREAGAEPYRLFANFRQNMARWTPDTFADAMKLARRSRHALECYTEFRAAAECLTLLDERLAGLVTQEPPRVARAGPVYHEFDETISG